MLEGYAQNNYETAKAIANLVDKTKLEKEDEAAYQKILFRMKLVPVVLKKLYNNFSNKVR
jgi:predicted RNA binding protein with dsRBD fold (UPF0201 family)